VVKKEPPVYELSIPLPSFDECEEILLREFLKYDGDCRLLGKEFQKNFHDDTNVLMPDQENDFFINKYNRIITGVHYGLFYLHLEWLLYKNIGNYSAREFIWHYKFIVADLGCLLWGTVRGLMNKSKLCTFGESSDKFLDEKLVDIFEELPDTFEGISKHTIVFQLTNTGEKFIKKTNPVLQISDSDICPDNMKLNNHLEILKAVRKFRPDWFSLGDIVPLIDPAKTTIRRWISAMLKIEFLESNDKKGPARKYRVKK